MTFFKMNLISIDLQKESKTGSSLELSGSLSNITLPTN
ncbi:hypothetical protein LEP1GSC137_2998 [Leptospira borgpetersenii str. Noumea 25]|uniref:Uncharacterized protein n=2 Tax=Leptospira borgpetersenii TaxID=174 RepID=A0A0S2ILI7_LEPBO|nr:hypothetical protein LBBP_00133 [Leptospira borgpetersenii serovar Ballum]EKR01674.1 hypothetical protein LEP1GSC121_0398 [Leptospira borgpetersenii serovar Castellonis str. 200801910]EMK14642.1 hypothetical protein LEP1GSC066_3626 [Leptospira sp. serovar Kenya str. Sh9]EMN13580.1 hypothetical protein LEP1GSC055_3762 [Leptospira borgpetersenii str. Brem 307]EMN17817.1 hypothetical protein LEP1GSC056_2833 [Leptospira borgpetersenii str. Brem 328]EMN59594.1 hypothetical protein LEP1GSC090_166